MFNLILVTAVVGLTMHSEAQRHCMDDMDCAELGKLICVRSACTWGICGCSAGTSPKYLGSKDNFGCVPNKKIGEYCSTTKGDGVCFAPNSFCEPQEEKCKCKPGFIPSWGGEACLNETDSSDHITCDDKETQDLVLPYGHTSFWKAPNCRPNAIGDTCFIDADCPNSGKRKPDGTYYNVGKCENNRCVCETGLVPDYYKMKCEQGLSIGETCASEFFNEDKICNGNKGLFCGDMCDLVAWNTPLVGAHLRKCVCGPSHKLVGSECVQNVIGSTCHGDLNCKLIGLRAVCHEATCQNGGGRPVMGWLLSILLPAVLYFFAYSP